MDFGSDPEFEEIFDRPEDEWSAGLEGLRYNFIVAGTPELAEQIYERVVGPSGAGAPALAASVREK
jgi:hypothetical protein